MDLTLLAFGVALLCLAAGLYLVNLRNERLDKAYAERMVCTCHHAPDMDGDCRKHPR